MSDLFVTNRTCVAGALGLGKELAHERGWRSMGAADVKKVLLVEDDPLDVTLIRRALSRTNFEFELRVLDDGEQAINFARQHVGGSWTPDLILLDLNLPRRLGGEVLEVLKAHAKLRIVPVVVLTSSDANSDVLNAYSSGASSYVRKPFSIDSIDDLVRTLQHYWFDLVILPSRAERL